MNSLRSSGYSFTHNNPAAPTSLLLKNCKHWPLCSANVMLYETKLNIYIDLIHYWQTFVMCFMLGNTLSHRFYSTCFYLPRHIIRQIFFVLYVINSKVLYSGRFSSMNKRKLEIDFDILGAKFPILDLSDNCSLILQHIYTQS